MLKDPRPADWLSVFIKRFIYSQLAVLDGLKTVVGRHKPTLTFSVLADPPSLYLNYEIKRDCLAEFTQYINLAEGLSLTPVACLEGEEPRYLLTLNIYEVSGLVSGPRAEWSTYIADEAGHPRYLVLEAQADKGSMDPVNIVTRAGQVTHSRIGDRVESSVIALDKQPFRSRIRLDDAHPVVRTEPAWIAANDYIYWRNGVYDRAWYNAQLFNARVRAIPAADVELDDQTHWTRFIDTNPRHVLHFDGAMDLMVSPWYNV
jgi:hypothetical protein